MSIAVTSLRIIGLLIAATVTLSNTASTMAGDDRPGATDRQSFTVQVGSKVRVIKDHQVADSATLSSVPNQATNLRLETTGPLVLQLSSIRAGRPSSTITPLVIYQGRTTIRFRSQNTESARIDAATNRSVQVHWPESELLVITIAAL